VLAAAREAIWKVGFSPSVFKKKEGKSKGVDIALTSDLLSHAFLDNYDAAVLIAGDGDYVRAIEEVKKRGKVAYVIFFRGDGAGLSPELRLAADAFFDLWPPFEYTWKQFLGAQTTAAAPMLTSARADIPR
jgi:uncharacterized LabA/DUF88 family protein